MSHRLRVVFTFAVQSVHIPALASLSSWPCHIVATMAKFVPPFFQHLRQVPWSYSRPFECHTTRHRVGARGRCDPLRLHREDCCSHSSQSHGSHFLRQCMHSRPSSLRSPTIPTRGLLLPQLTVPRAPLSLVCSDHQTIHGPCSPSALSLFIASIPLLSSLPQRQSLSLFVFPRILASCRSILVIPNVPTCHSSLGFVQHMTYCAGASISPSFVVRLLFRSPTNLPPTPIIPLSGHVSRHRSLHLYSHIPVRYMDYSGLPFYIIRTSL
ncbi:hypothetical protein BV22DRAFT_289465 [Leucogyrophana mollusca]|uniref:Uncharacterized protein n=1 Tax=Leucogyrophana mollusca TaxID=85980 RepID=A0ACB8BNX3_9AGAM|nr:hypothetical protein BV22DRAFT_289465 [Leucogyrophana mollusca]